MGLVGTAYHVTRDSQWKAYVDLLRPVAPKIFTLFFPMIKPFISQQTIRNFRIFGTDRAQWTAALLDEIDPSQLPVHYGGTLADPDGNPMYLSKVSPPDEQHVGSLLIRRNSARFVWAEKYPALTT